LKPIIRNLFIAFFLAGERNGYWNIFVLRTFCAGKPSSPMIFTQEHIKVTVGLQIVDVAILIFVVADKGTEVPALSPYPKTPVRLMHSLPNAL
jgi:hypothetical protein